MLETIKNWIGALTEVGLLLLALAIVAALLIGIRTITIRIPSMVVGANELAKQAPGLVGVKGF